MSRVLYLISDFNSRDSPNLHLQNKVQRIISCKLWLMCQLRRFDVISRDYTTGKCGHCWSITGQFGAKFGQ